MRHIKEIILHCSATPEGRDIKAKDIDLWHRRRGFISIGYHYVIDLDGTIEKGRDIKLNGAHCKGHNSNSIGICYVGGCDKKMYAKDTRTPQQRESLIKLVHQLLDEYGLTLDAVYAHYQFASYKACPSFKIEDFKTEFKQYYNNKENDV